MSEVTSLLEPGKLVGVLVLTTTLIAVTSSWRLALLALLAQYVALGSLLARTTAPPTGGTRLVVGALVCLVLYLTLRQTDGLNILPVGTRLRVSRATFRMAALALAGLGVFGTPARQMAPGLPAPLATAALWLMAAGLFIVVLRAARLWVGLGILSFTSGLEALASMQQSTPLMAGLRASSQLFLALLVAITLIASRGTAPSSGSRHSA